MVVIARRLGKRVSSEVADGLADDLSSRGFNVEFDSSIRIYRVFPSVYDSDHSRRDIPLGVIGRSRDGGCYLEEANLDKIFLPSDRMALSRAYAVA
tara:strand:+ start:380 stop:667 length:288 start_codon:yes stop_codon:yes gene_type:complete